MISAEALAEARTWIGTPYHHQASVKGVGADCLGLLRGVWRNLYGDEPEVMPAYTPDWSETRGVELLQQGAARHLLQKSLTDAAPGDVLLFRMKGAAVAKHLGLQSATGATSKFIHAYSRHGVIENHLSAAWARRVVARFEFPDRRA